MFNLLKYELRKTLGIKGIILVITAILEVVYLVGLYGEFDSAIAWSIMGLTFGSFAAIVLIGVHSVSILNKDLNTKQAYMLFMTPNNSYKILGAKMIESSLSIIIGGAFFILLGALDITLAVTKYGVLQDMLDFVNIFLSDLQQITPESVISLVCNFLGNWVFIIATAFFAVVVCATFLNGRKHNGLISFLIFIVLNVVINWAVSKIFGTDSFDLTIAHTVVMFAVNIVLSAIMYVISAWVMDNKLSV